MGERQSYYYSYQTCHYCKNLHRDVRYTCENDIRKKRKCKASFCSECIDSFFPEYYISEREDSDYGEVSFRMQSGYVRCVNWTAFVDSVKRRGRSILSLITKLLIIISSSPETISIMIPERDMPRLTINLERSQAILRNCLKIKSS